MQVKKIEHKGETLALIFSEKIETNGVRFLTPENYSLQLGLIQHPRGHIIEDHIHNPDIEYKVDTTQEFIYVEKGKLQVKIFSPSWDLIEKVKLSSGDFALFIAGGHGFEVIEDCRLIEVKQGPYPGDAKAKIYRKNKKHR